MIDLFTPCTVGDWQLPAKFRSLTPWFHCNCKAGAGPIAWLLFGTYTLGFRTPTDGELEIELASWGPVTLTREATEQEQEDWREAQYEF